MINSIRIFRFNRGRRRFSIRKLSLMSSSSSDSQPFSRLIALLSRHLKMLCIRRLVLQHTDAAESFWQSIAQCRRLAAFQYEPKCLDRFSRAVMVDALRDKRRLKSLAITNIKVRLFEKHRNLTIDSYRISTALISNRSSSIVVISNVSQSFVHIFIHGTM